MKEMPRGHVKTDLEGSDQRSDVTAQGTGHSGRLKLKRMVKKLPYSESVEALDPAAVSLRSDEATDPPSEPRGQHLESLVSTATADPARAVPYRAEMERAFGADFSGVRAHMGPGSQMANQELGARGFAVGSRVSFDSSSPSKGVVAHELAHVLQQGGESVTRAKLEVTPAHDFHEKQADEAAHNVVSGRSADGSPLGMSGPDSAGPPKSAEPGGPYRFATGSLMAQSIMCDRAYPELAGGPKLVERSSSASSQQMAVRPKATKRKPLKGTTPPSEEQLFESREGEAPRGWKRVKGTSGSVEEPNVIAKPCDPIFIGGKPAMEDIEQGGIGDCWLLAALTSAVVSDPAKIRKMISGTNEKGGKAWLYHLVPRSRPERWKGRSHKASGDYDIETDDEGKPSPVGAQFRVADQPKETCWYVQIMQDQLYIVRQDEYEMATWVPLFEQAYADFTSKYGKDGRGGEGKGGSKSDPEIIAGGSGGFAFPVFYGRALREAGQIDIDMAPGGEIVAKNLETVKRLFQLQNQKPDDKTQILLTVARTSVGAMFGAQELALKLRMAILQGEDILGSGIEPSKRGQAKDTLYEDCVILYDLIDAYTDRLMELSEELDAGRIDQSKFDRIDKVIEWAVSVWATSVLARNEEVFATSNHRQVKILHRQLLTLEDLQEDLGKGRHIFAQHEYSVIGVSLLKADGTAFSGELTPDTANTIDAEKSTVRLRNPHATNEPDPHGRGIPPREDEGMFTMTLDEFLTSFGTLDYGVVKRSKK